jgi:hypothetical protein
MLIPRMQVIESRRKDWFQAGKLEKTLPHWQWGREQEMELVGVVAGLMWKLHATEPCAMTWHNVLGKLLFLPT